MTPLEFVNQELKLIEMTFNVQGVLNPMVVFVKDNNRTATAVEFRHELHKDIMAQGIKELVKMSEPDVVIYSAEAWGAFYSKDEDLNKADRPEFRPDREELVVARIEFKTGEKYDCDAKIIREKGHARLDRFRIQPGGNSMGRFVDFFPITKPN